MDRVAAMSLADSKQAELNRELGLAAMINDVKRLKEMLAAGADVESIPDVGYTQAHPSFRFPAAAPFGFHTVAFHRTYNATDVLKWRPLHLAVKGNATDATKALVDVGADVETSDGEGRRPLHLAIEKDALEAIEILIEARADVEGAHYTNGRRPLHLAAAKNALDMMKLLIDADADVEAIDGLERRPLHSAASKNASDAIKVLIKEGADVNATNKKGETPLHEAAENNASDAMKALIDAGANVEATDVLERRPLHSAANTNASDTIQILIEEGADVNATSREGKTPLYEAVVRDRLNALQLLLGAGADFQICDSNGKTPLQAAKNTGHNVSATVLEKEANRHFVTQLESQEESDSDGASSLEPKSSTQPLAEKQTPAITPVVKSASKELPLSQSQAQHTQAPTNTVDVSPRSFHEDSTTSTTSSSWTSEEATDQVRAVQDLKEDDIFAEDYCLERKLVLGKPLVRLAKRLQTNRAVVLKFYDNPKLYVKALASYKHLNKSDYVCKPIEKIDAHQGFPNCLAFDKGFHTLDEWMRIPNINATSKKETLQLVAAALYDLHSLNIVHCDVKPANLAFFPSEHMWKLLDIDSALEVGVAGDIITTISYASPEVLQAVEEGQTELALQASADMWAYGIIAFEVFTGKRFYEEEPTIESVLGFVRSERFKKRLDLVEDRKQRRFVNKFLKLNASDRLSAQDAYTSSIFHSPTVTVSKPLVSRE